MVGGGRISKLVNDCLHHRIRRNRTGKRPKDAAEALRLRLTSGDLHTGGAGVEDGRTDEQRGGDRKRHVDRPAVPKHEGEQGLPEE